MNTQEVINGLNEIIKKGSLKGDNEVLENAIQALEFLYPKALERGDLKEYLDPDDRVYEDETEKNKECKEKEAEIIIRIENGLVTSVYSRDLDWINYEVLDEDVIDNDVEEDRVELRKEIKTMKAF